MQRGSEMEHKAAPISAYAEQVRWFNLLVVQPVFS